MSIWETIKDIFTSGKLIKQLEEIIEQEEQVLKQEVKKVETQITDAVTAVRTPRKKTKK